MKNPPDNCAKDQICNKSSNMTRKGDRTAVLTDLTRIELINILHKQKVPPLFALLCVMKEYPQKCWSFLGMFSILVYLGSEMVVWGHKSMFKSSKEFTRLVPLLYGI
jgi:hypothetical protein